MRNITKLLLLSCSIIATNAHAGSSALGSSSEDDVVSILKRAITKLQGPSPQDQSAKRICRSEDESEATQRPQINVHVKIEPDHTTLPRLLTPNDIEEALPQFNPEKGEKNCLACNTKFVKWIMTGTLEPAEGQDSQGHNIAIYDRFAALLDEQQALDSQHLPQGLKDEAALRLAVMRYANRTDVIRDDQAVRYFLRALNSQYLTQVSKDVTAFRLASMRCANRTVAITDEQVVQYFWQALNSQHLRQGLKDEAALRLAVMHCENRTAAITDERAVQYLQQALNSPHLSQVAKDTAALVLERMRCTNRTAAITDDQAAVQYSLQALNSQHLSQGSKDEAALELARMRCANRTSAITDDQAVQYFQDTLNSQHLTQDLKDEAVLELARMRYENRTAAITDERAVRLLSSMISSASNWALIKSAGGLLGKLLERM